MQVIPDSRAELGLSITEATTRAQIIGATIATIAEQGYARTTFTRIKERAGLSSTRLISYHFTNKAGLLQAVLSTVVETRTQYLSEHSTGIDPGDRRGNLRAYLETSVAFLRDYPQCVQVLVELGAHTGDRDGWSMTGVMLTQVRTGFVQRQLEQGKREGVFGDISADVVALSIAQAVDGVAAAYAADPALDLDRYGRELADLFDRATAVR
ncbi:TetR family transcriptional regulator [Amycolatopsis sulphurea]|uniref:TetR family transcriptional regulator n=1 Tax=Amycolatopsis sulphurea TaxID=76022 RepID=A0A2A9G373_9PSEU|nr:TetR/AcrR family transcriptional regulator [Amycolatopsis sulphurea]PFG57603.1 TetR family transcriptional regulator [Amycolatopsis sulphurea]